MGPDEIVLLIAEKCQDRGVRWHIENYAATRAAVERLLRTMEIVPEQSPRQITSSTALNEKTQVVPLYERGIATFQRRT